MVKINTGVNIITCGFTHLFPLSFSSRLAYHPIRMQGAPVHLEREAMQSLSQISNMGKTVQWRTVMSGINGIPLIHFKSDMRKQSSKMTAKHLATSITLATALTIISVQPAMAGNECRKFQPKVSWANGPSPNPGKIHLQIAWEFLGPASCRDAVHIRFGEAGKTPFIIKETGFGKNCGYYTNEGRPLPRCAYNVEVNYGIMYEASVQACHKHALSGDACSSWGSSKISFPRPG